jgi:dipeptidyl-peptidase-4
VDAANGEKQILVSHEQLASLRGKLLLVHGIADDNGHMQNSLQLAQEFIQAGKQFDLLLYPQKTHSISGPVARRHLFMAITEYFKKSLYRMRIR